jgi:hypothetical protein
MKPSPSKSAKAAGKKRGCEEAAAAATGAAPPMSPPRADPSREWKKSKVKTEDLLALLNSGFIREKEVDMWRAAAGDPYPMEKAEDEIPMFVRFVERGLALPTSNFFKGLLGYYGVEYLNLNPNGVFHSACRMDLPGPTTSVGTRTDYSVGPWDYPPYATRHLKAWSTRTTQE